MGTSVQKITEKTHIQQLSNSIMTLTHFDAACFVAMQEAREAKTKTKSRSNTGNSSIGWCGTSVCKSRASSYIKPRTSTNSSNTSYGLMNIHPDATIFWTGPC